MKIGLRRKLDALVFLTVFLALGPYAVYSLWFFSDKTLENAQKKFQIVGIMAANEILEGYTSLVEAQVQEAARQKRNIKNITRLVANLWSDLEQLGPVAEPTMAHQLAELRHQSVSVTWLNKQGQTQMPFPTLFNLPAWGEIKDITGRSLQERMASEQLPEEGEFTIITLPNQSGDPTYLGLLRPDENNTGFFMALVSVDDIKNQAKINNQFIVEHLAHLLEEFKLDPQLMAYLVDANSGEVLLPQGGKLNPDLIIPDLIQKADVAGYVETMIDLPGIGPSFLRLHSFRPLNWYFALIAPRDYLNTPVKHVVLRLLPLALAGAVGSIIMATVVAHWIARPISKLAKEVTRMAQEDFTSFQPEKFFQDVKMEARHDEIGRLTSAFRHMTMTIVSNLKQLLAATRLTERLDGELTAARNIQLGMLPPPGEKDLSPILKVASFLNPAKEVGGDLYVYHKDPKGKVILAMGDVSGKGVPAALFMSMTVTLIRVTMLDGVNSPEAAMTKINEFLGHNNPHNMFVTLFIGLYDPATKELEFANGGHCQPLLVGPNQVRKLPGLSGPMVGALDSYDYKGFSMTMQAGEKLFLYTDGVTEAQNEGGEFFGQASLEKVLKQHGANNPADLNEEVHRAVMEFSGTASAYDDLALLAIGPF